jgi:hypothetical protein
LRISAHSKPEVTPVAANANFAVRFLELIVLLSNRVAGGPGLNVAVTVTEELIVIVHVCVPAQLPPDQPANAEPGEATA